MQKGGQTIYTQSVDPSDLFKDTAEELQSHGLQRFYFLLQDENGGFGTAYTSEKRHIHLTEKESLILGQERAWEVILLPEDLKSENFPLIKNHVLLKLRWKMQWYDIRAVMPVFYNNKLICLVLFGDENFDYSQKKHSEFLKNIKQDLADCLYCVLHYNQTREWLKGEIERQGMSDE